MRVPRTLGSRAPWKQACLTSPCSTGEYGGEGRGLGRSCPENLFGQPEMCVCPGAAGLCSRREPGVGTAASSMHVQGGDLLPDDTPSEGPGGGAGEEVQEGGDTGHRGWGQ